MPALDAVVFDLYGTLLHIGQRSIHREIPRLLGAPRERWLSLLRHDLLTRAFPDDAAFVRHIAGTLAERLAPGAEAACLAAVAREVGSVAPVPGILPLLHFLKRRGLKLGLLSNLASPHKEPLRRFGLAELFDAAAFSCDEGVVKPAPELYRNLLERLGVEPARALFVGDSRANDVEAPAALGMRTAGVAVPAGDLRLAATFELGCHELTDGSFRRLLYEGQRVEVDGTPFTIRRIEPVPDDEQGRYNLVYALDVDRVPPSFPARLYAKRFLLPETAQMEVFGYRLQEACGLSACRAGFIPGPEPLLLVTGAPGRKLDADVTPAVSYEIGRHSAFAFLFSNADLRPRNAFRCDMGDTSLVTFIDMEHILFNLAIDTAGLAEPFRPETFDGMPPDELERRTKKRVLSSRAMGRARRSFFGDTPRGSDNDRAFHDGFVDFFRAQQWQADALCGLIAARVHAEPPLVIGTHSYRRAMANVDVDDIRARLRLEPEDALAWSY